jgi:hypothetical protein
MQDAGSTVLYAGMAGAQDGGGSFGGHVFADLAAGTAGAGTVWTDLAKSAVTNDVADAGVFNPGGFDVSSVAADPHDATGLTVYATVMGFAGNGVNAPHVYRSTNGGASWTNISGNLPNAPANGVLVDPNDANTLYVAMDTGVYATTQVATCASANCWSAFGTGLPNSPVTALAAGAGMAGHLGDPAADGVYPGGPGDDAGPGQLDVCGTGHCDGKRGADHYGYKYRQRCVDGNANCNHWRFQRDG